MLKAKMQGFWIVIPLLAYSCHPIDAMMFISYSQERLRVRQIRPYGILFKVGDTQTNDIQQQLHPYIERLSYRFIPQS